MAQYNSANGSFQSFNGVLFDAEYIVCNGAVVSANNPFPVTFSGNVSSNSSNGTVLLQTGNTLYTNNNIVISNTTSLIANAAANGVTYIHREVQNSGPNVIYIGNSTVTTNTGYPVLPNGVYDFSRFTGSLYGIISSNTSTQNCATMQY